jgi:queuine tRNA-ribosyltransferase
MRSGFSFQIDAEDGSARAGRLVTPHGSVETPAFMAVATSGAVRGVGPAELAGVGAGMLLANTFHLHERPGEDLIARAGGLHGFTGWRGPWLTDSGGYQVFSLASRVKLEEEGVTFSSTIDGRTRRLTPEGAVAIQEALGPDVAMVLDQCVPSAVRGPEGNPSQALSKGNPPEALWKEAMERTLRWGERCRRAHTRSDQALFGIVQGGASPALRRASARGTGALDFDGFAHGGLGLGEAPSQRADLVSEAHAELPASAPRYLMGIGRPADLVAAVERGVDLFDCVIPTRHARHGVAFTAGGPLSLKNARFREDFAPLDAGCDCPTCALHGRGYLRHLFQAGEMLGGRLLTLHNLRFYFRLLERLRGAIRSGRFAALRRELAGAEGSD